MYLLTSRVTSVRAISVPAGFSKNLASSSEILVGFTNPEGARFPAFLLRLELCFCAALSSRAHFFSRARNSLFNDEIPTLICCSFAANSTDCSARGASLSEAAAGSSVATTDSVTTGADSALGALATFTFFSLGATSTEVGAGAATCSVSVVLVALVCLTILLYYT